MEPCFTVRLISGLVWTLESGYGPGVTIEVGTIDETEGTAHALHAHRTPGGPTLQVSDRVNKQASLTRMVNAV